MIKRLGCLKHDKLLKGLKHDGIFGMYFKQFPNMCQHQGDSEE